jgi:GNAT superfamily N-acetyltransferase
MSLHPVAPCPSLHHVVRPSRGVDLPTIGAVLAAAFQDDPVACWIIPDDGRRRAILPSLMRLLAARFQPHGANQVNETGTGAAVWAPPGAEFTAEEDLWFGDELASILGDALGRARELTAVVDVHRPHDPHRYLVRFGVVPSHQGVGIASALLGAVLDRVDRVGGATYLEASSPQSRALFERHGFEVTRELRCAGAPPLWGMWRDGSQAGLTSTSW